MTRVTTIRLILIAIVGAAWAVPLVRAARLLSYAYSVDNGSINTGNDLAFGADLILSYNFSFAVALALAWFLPSTRVWLLALPFAASLLIAFDVIRMKPERVIVLFPTMNPFRPAGFSLLVVLGGIFVVWLHRKRVKHDGGEIAIPH